MRFDQQTSRVEADDLRIGARRDPLPDVRVRDRVRDLDAPPHQQLANLGEPSLASLGLGWRDVNGKVQPWGVDIVVELIARKYR
jgi:hypothetical protein